MKRLVLNQQGFTLLEAIIAMAILSIGVLAAAAMQGHAIRASTTAYNRTGADSVAMAFFEALQAMPYKDIAPDDDQDGLFVDKGLDNVRRQLSKNPENMPTGKLYPTEKTSLPKLIEKVAQVGKAKHQVCETASGKCYSLVYSTQKIGEQAMNIRLLMVWQTPYGNNHLVYTTTRYNNKAEK